MAATSPWALPCALVACPYDADHRVRPERMAAHLRRCERKLRRIDGNDADDARPRRKVPSSLGFYTKAPAVVSFVTATADAPERRRRAAQDEHTVLVLDPMETAPPPVWDGLGPASPSADAERAAYDRVLAIAHQLRATEALPVPSAALPAPFEAELYRIRKERQERERRGGRKSEAEQLASAASDYRRRRASYRAKNVRITQRSATQIMRDILAAYMDDLQRLNAHLARSEAATPAPG